MNKILLFTVLSMTLLISCSKSEPPAMSVKNKDITLFREGTEKLIVENAPEDISYKSENDLIAKVSEDGVIEGRVRGNTKIAITSGSESAIANVEVKTLINYIPEPYLGFGESMTSVKGKINTKETIIDIEDGFGFLQKVDGEDVLYAYTFEDDKLNLSFFAFNTISSLTSDISSMLLERYVPVTQTGTYSFGFISPDEKMAVLFTQSDDYRQIMVGYTEIGEDDLKSTRSNEIIHRLEASLNHEVVSAILNK